MFLYLIIASFAIFYSEATHLCDTGFETSASGACYQVIDTSTKTWAEARQHCKAVHSDADLVRFEDLADEESVIPKETSWSHFWIGANDKTVEKNYRWLDDTNSTTYTNWSPGQPTASVNFDCVAVATDSSGWSEFFCDTSLPFICGYTPSAQEDTTEDAAASDNSTADGATNGAGTANNAIASDSGAESGNSSTVHATSAAEMDRIIFQLDQCEDGWKMLGDLGCVKLYLDAKLTWWEARNNCMADGADLAIVPNITVHRLIKGLLFQDTGVVDRHRYWFGLIQRTDDGPFKWLDDVKLDPNFSRWCKQRSVVADSLEKPICGLMVASKAGRWNVDSCKAFHFSVCMKNNAIEKLLQTAREALPPVTTTEKATTLTTTDQNEQTEPESEQTIGGSTLEENGDGVVV